MLIVQIPQEIFLVPVNQVIQEMASIVLVIFSFFSFFSFFFFFLFDFLIFIQFFYCYVFLAIKCPSISFGNANYSSTFAGNTALGKCDNSYYGSPTLYCNLTGSWNQTINGNPCSGLSFDLISFLFFCFIFLFFFFFLKFKPK